MEKPEIDSSEISFDVLSSQSQKESNIQAEKITMEDEECMEVEETHKTEDLKESIKVLSDKLSAALANVSAKDELVKQHVKVAEEAVAGWEKAENEAIDLKENLDSSNDKNRVLEDRVNHLDGALKECVRQLRQARDEQEEKIQEAVSVRILENSRKIDELSEMAESVAKENVMLRHELIARCEELEIRTIERDLSTQAAESASKQQLDVIKKMAKLEAECRKFRMLSRSSASLNDHRSTDSHSDGGGGDRMDVSCSESSTLIEKRTCSSIELDLMGDFLEMERLVALPETKDVWEEENSLAAVIEALGCRNKELEDKLKKMEAEKAELENEVKCNREQVNTLRFELESISCDKTEFEEKLKKLEAEKDELECKREIDSKLRFELEAIVCDKMELEEKLNTLEKEKNKSESEMESNLRELEAELKKLEGEKDELKCEVKCSREAESMLRCELEAIVYDKKELESKLEKMEVEKAELQISFDIIKDKYKESQVCLRDIELKLEEIQTEMKLANELKANVKSQIINLEVEVKNKSIKIESLEEKVRKDKFLSDELKRKCEDLEEEIKREDKTEPKIKQEDIVNAAGKLANCQKTIASLGKQLESLATLEDFLIDTPTIPPVAAANGVNSSWNGHKKDTFTARETSLSSSDGSSNRGSSEKNRNGFAKVFTRSKDGIHLGI